MKSLKSFLFVGGFTALSFSVAPAADAFPGFASYYFNKGKKEGISIGIQKGRQMEQDALAAEGSAPPLASVDQLGDGMKAPTFDVGSDTVNKATVTFSNSIGSSDTFNVGATTNVGATASASSTPDYDVTSNAKFGMGGSSIKQVIGNEAGVPGPLSAISGTFSKVYTPDSVDNQVTVDGIGTTSKVKATGGSKFVSNVNKGKTTQFDDGTLYNPGAGVGNGSANGSVGTTTTAAATSSQFVSSFAQAY